MRLSMQVGRCRNKADGKNFSFLATPLQADGTAKVSLWDGRPTKAAYRTAKLMPMTLGEFTLHFDIVMVSM